MRISDWSSDVCSSDLLDIDMARAADLLGMEKRTAEMFRDLERGHFVALGPAVSRRPLPIRIGEVQTSTRSTSPKLMPPPAPSGDDLRDLIFAPAPASTAERRVGTERGSKSRTRGSPKQV